ncbi:MAG: phosphatidylserine decarboxylase family protein [Nitrospirales bacterium]|nr:phosphatidylserine decarboxylase family protein [Nitrospira sp.]MDR4502031.1 phosphatidylserine decarboxylase family protein [Nitrospirales bacterium]
MADRAAGLPVAREGLPFVLGAAIPAMVAGRVGWRGTALALGAVAGYCAWFFRNPARSIPSGDDLIVSPGDGKVVAIEREFESRFLKTDSIRVSIFLNIFNVHINRVPCGGVLQDVVYQPGQFIPADRPDASVNNEQNALMIRRADGKKVLCVQVAGLIARRIVCWALPGEQVQKGERFGLIRFGSRMDLYLPHESHVSVKVGEHVKGGTSVIAELACEAEKV